MHAVTKLTLIKPIQKNERKKYHYYKKIENH